MKIGIANSAEVDALWPLFAERLEKGCRRCGGDINAGQLWQLCRSGNAFMVVAIGEKPVGVTIVQFQTWNRPVLRSLATAGWEMDSWLPQMLDFVMQMARENRADFVFEGREGWGKLVPGARKLRSVYEVIL